jgi:ribosomal protein S18 acetylase RimI-like enzyme
MAGLDMSDTIGLLDELAANAWPAIVQQGLDGWRLRSSVGVTRRANSVYSAGRGPSYAGWLQDVELFYRRRRLPVRFQISPASPPELDSFLQEQGYRVDAETSVMVATTATVCERARAASRLTLHAHSGITARWLDAFLRIEGFSDDRRLEYERILGTIGPPSCFVLLHDGAEEMGVGMSVAERGWAGIFCVATDEKYRRQGVAQQVMSALAEWSQDQGARNLYLQVMATNTPAVTLYGKLAFSHLYFYHYREK